MAIKTISQFPSGIPADNDYILFEQNGEGKSATFADLPVSTAVQGGLDTKINKTDALTYEEIMASTPPVDLDLAVAKASAVKKVINSFSKRVIYAGDLKTKAAIKDWVVRNKPGSPWVASASDEACSTVLGTIFNDYQGGYVAFIDFNYFSSSIEIYKFNAGSWNK